MTLSPLAIGGWTVFGLALLTLLVGSFGPKSKKNKGLSIALGLAILAGAIYMLIMGYKPIPSSGPTPTPDIPASSSGTATIFHGGVGPSFNTIPGRITITGVSEAKSSPGIFISFTSDGQCSECQAVFDMSMTYNDGTVDSKEVTTSVTSHEVYADYSPTMRPLAPGPVQISITGFSINPMVSGSQGPISQPYTLTTQ